ncbi:MAG: hypothetical protein ABL998_09540, partial [Planctomycetota bacterium]
WLAKDCGRTVELIEIAGVGVGRSGVALRQGYAAEVCAPLDSLVPTTDFPARLDICTELLNHSI